MEKFKNYTRQKWERIGFLEDTPEDRKDKVANVLNILMKTVIENQTHSDDTQFEVIPFPVIIRIVNAVDVPDEEISRLYNEMRQAFKKFSTPENLAKVYGMHEGMNLDYETEFAYDYANKKIEEYKQK